MWMRETARPHFSTPNLFGVASTLTLSFNAHPSTSAHPHYAPANATIRHGSGRTAECAQLLMFYGHCVEGKSNDGLAAVMAGTASCLEFWGLCSARAGHRAQ